MVVVAATAAPSAFASTATPRSAPVSSGLRDSGHDIVRLDGGGTSPTLVTAGDQVLRYARAGDHTLRQQRHEAGAWQGRQKRQELFPSAAFDGAPGAVPGANGTVDAVHRGVDGTVHRTAFM